MIRAIQIEPGELPDGTRVYRMRCEQCNRVGVWHTNAAVAEKTADLHGRVVHTEAKGAA